MIAAAPATLSPTPVLETQRLWLRPLEAADAPAIQRLFPRWEVVRHLVATPWPYPDDGAASFLTMATGEMARGEKSHWSLRAKADPETLMGVISLWPERPPQRDQRGFWLAPEFQGQGYMTEAAGRVTDYALLELGWPGLWLTNSLANTASAAIKQRQGATLVATEPAVYVEGPGTRQIWRLEAAAWRARRAGPKASS